MNFVRSKTKSKSISTLKSRSKSKSNSSKSSSTRSSSTIPSSTRSSSTIPSSTKSITPESVLVELKTGKSSSQTEITFPEPIAVTKLNYDEKISKRMNMLLHLFSFKTPIIRKYGPC